MTKKLTLLALLAQDEIWVPQGKPPILVTQMNPKHVRNLITWFERRASHFKEHYTWNMILSAAGSYGPHGEIAQELVDSEVDQLERTAPETWLNSWPLIKKLRELDAAYRAAETKLAAIKNDRLPAGATARLDRARGART